MDGDILEPFSLDLDNYCSDLTGKLKALEPALLK